MLLFKGEKELHPKEQKLITCLCSHCPEIKTVRTLAREFYQMMKKRAGTGTIRELAISATKGVSEG